MPSGEGEADPNAPLFFLSYARPKRPPGTPTTERSPNREILRLFEDLSTDVGELLGRDTGAYPGFIDRSMRGGELWETDIFTAAGRCQVFIPLVSASLAGSEWCGKEWDAFACREYEPRHSKQSEYRAAILPVIWAPFEMSAMPKVIRDIQLFTPTGLPEYVIAEKYQEEGVLGLLRLGMEQAYRSVVWRLARETVAVSRSYHVRPSIPDPRQLRNIFKDPR